MKENTSAFKSYLIGFLLSIILTFAAYIPVVLHTNFYKDVLPYPLLLPVIIGFAFLQLMVQVIFFLHILQESRPRWNLVFFVGTLSLVFLVIVASIWIMNHLNYNMTPTEMSNYLINKGEGF